VPPANGGGRGYTADDPRVLGRANRISHIQSLLLWGLLFSSIGLGFFIYGRRQRVVVPLVCGLALMVFPYFVANVALLVGIGIVLITIPYFLRR
jgi:predicted membrane protein